MSNSQNSSHELHLFGLLIEQINQKLGMGAAYEQILGFVFDSLDLLIPYDLMGIALLEPNGERLIVDWVRSKAKAPRTAKGYVSVPVRGSFIEPILHTMEPKIVQDLHEHLSEHPYSDGIRNLIEDGFRSALFGGLRSQNKPIGAVCFACRNLYAYENQHLEIFRTITGELSVLVAHDQMRLSHEKSQDLRTSLEVLLQSLKTPVATMRGFLDLATGQAWYPQMDPEARVICSALDRSTNSMLDLLDELSALTESS